MSWKDKFEKARQTYQQRTDVSNQTNKPTDPAPPIPTWTGFEIRKHNFDNFHSTSKNTAVPTVIGRYPIFEPVKTGRRKFHKDWTPLYPFHWTRDDQNLEIWKRFKTLMLRFKLIESNSLKINEFLLDYLILLVLIYLTPYTLPYPAINQAC